MRALVLLLAFATQAFANLPGHLPFEGSSSVPEAGLPSAVEVNKSFQKTMRVKVFPHDLRSDWVHGKPDNARSVELRGSFAINGRAATGAKIVLQAPNLKITLPGGVYFYSKHLSVTSTEPVQVWRERNKEKSHSYLGSLEIFPDSGEITVVNHVDIETYLRGVVPKESVSSWPLEALKAQAVAARTYAYYHLLTSNRKNWDVDDTARFQVYAGQSAATTNTDLAVEQTRGEVLTQNGKIIVAYFHAYSGGRTDSSLNIFGSPADYCLGNEEIFTREELRRELQPSARWIVEWTTDWMKKSTLMEKLKRSSHSDGAFRNYSSSRSFTMEESELNPRFNSVKTLTFRQSGKAATLDFINIRKILGWSNFPAYHFRLLDNGSESVAFRGHGWGHHVGMSQWGAFMMAKNYAATYDEILHHYYANVELGHL